MELSEEEKKAIDYLKNDVVYWLDKGKDFVVIDIGENEKLHSILNLIDKQQKEIEGKNAVIDSFKHTEKVLTEQLDNQQKEIEELKHNRDEYKEEYIKLLNARYYNYISKDKIREKIKELETAINQNKIMSIQVRQHGFTQKTIEQYVIRATAEILKELLEDNGDHIPRID